MDRRQAYERRVWRLAHLLASPDQAIPLVHRVVWRRGGDLDQLDPAHLDRLVILTARDLPRTPKGGPAARPDGQAVPGGAIPGPAAALRAHLHAMPRQPMEAWVLSRLDGLDLMAASRAMDCSKTATARHLEAADEHLRQRYGRGGCEPATSLADTAVAQPDELTVATAALRNWVDALDPAPALARAHREARIQRRVRLALIVLGGVIVLGGLALLARSVVALN